MGTDIRGIIEKHPITFEMLRGKVIAIDAFNILYQFLASIRQEDGTPLMDFKGNPTGHLSGLFYRTARLIANNIKPVYVFDGVPPIFKQKEIVRRRELKKEAEFKWREALDYGRVEDAKKFAQATSRLSEEMVMESKQLLCALGLPYIEAPSEGEAQAAAMVKNRIAFASASQDYDSLLFGTPKLIRNLSITGKRKVPNEERYVLIEPEEIRLDEVLSLLQINREQLILIGILSGTDFNNGVKGVGAKTALKIVKENKDVGSMKTYVKNKYKYEFEEDVDAIFDFFLNPPIYECINIKFGKPEFKAVEHILVEEHNFSEERVRKVLNEMEKTLATAGMQRKIEEWF